jgi:hypothetical protein
VDFAFLDAGHDYAAEWLGVVQAVHAFGRADLCATQCLHCWLLAKGTDTPAARSAPTTSPAITSGSRWRMGYRANRPNLVAFICDVVNVGQRTPKEELQDEPQSL